MDGDCLKLSLQLSPALQTDLLGAELRLSKKSFLFANLLEKRLPDLVPDQRLGFGFSQQ